MMDLEAVTFPALIVANDGWVQYLSSVEQLSLWTTSAIRKYNRRRIVLYDSNDRAWEVDGIDPIKRVGFAQDYSEKKFQSGCRFALSLKRHFRLYAM